MSRVGCTLGLIFLFSAGSFAQGLPPPPVQEESQQVFFEVLSLPGGDSLARLDVLYRLEESFFISARSFDSASAGEFKRRGETVIEVIDAEGTSRAREIHRIDIEAAPEKKEDMPIRWYERIATFAVAPGTYSISLEVSDLESDRKLTQRSRPIQARHFSGEKINASSLLFVSSASHETVIPSNFGGNVLFGAKGGMFVQLYLPASSENVGNARLQYSLRETRKDRESAVTLVDTTISVSLAQDGFLTASDSASYSLSRKTTSSVFSLFVPLLLDQLRLRQFDLDAVITAGSDSVSLNRQFRMIWPGMPRSLRNVDMALDALRFITRKEELDSLKSGSMETRILHLEGFWQPKDRTPGTPLNETMAEYYKRVDHAMITFGTMRDPDGTHNDRGRTYILHGQPTEIERNLDATEAQEVWTYQHLRKRFIFIDRTRTGLYSLVSTQSL